MKSDYRVRAFNFLKSIFPYICDTMESAWETEQAVWRYNVIKSRNVQCMSGSARIALITSDYVIKWDYDEENVQEIGGCDVEYENYREAVAAGYGHLFAETTQVEYNGITFNIMPRVKNIGRKHHAYDIDHYMTREEYNWVSHFISDLHSYNWGIMNNRAVIIDYAYRYDWGY